jgi:hypothetical protein
MRQAPLADEVGLRGKNLEVSRPVGSISTLRALKKLLRNVACGALDTVAGSVIGRRLCCGRHADGQRRGEEYRDRYPAMLH